MGIVLRRIIYLCIVSAFTVLSGCGDSLGGRRAVAPTATGSLGQALTEFALPTPNSGPDSSTMGPDGHLWFTEHEANKIGRITPAGTITEFMVPSPTARPYRIASSADGSLWFTELDGGKLGRLTTTGDLTEFELPTPNARPLGIGSGRDGELWFVEAEANKLGRVQPGAVK